MAGKIGFKSYCWSIGTTSYRTDDFNMNIERQLSLLREFRELDENTGRAWTGNNPFQIKYYHFLQERGFVKGNAPRPDKDAREKTSGLRDIGLLDDERRITPAGHALLSVFDSKKYDSDNALEIPADSYLYLKQLIKTANEVGGKTVRPFVIFLYVVSRAEYLTYEEFTYLLPLCIDPETTETILRLIAGSRTGGGNYEAAILSVLMNMDNYKAALKRFLGEEVTEELICEIGMNRKSARYDKPYYELYRLLRGIVFEKDDLALKLYEATRKLTNGKIGGAWRKYFFHSDARSVIRREGLSVLNDVPILNAASEREFKLEFFRIMHLFKAKATLSDYFDLNRRYFKLTDTVLFEDGRVRLDVLPKCYVDSISDRLLSFAFEPSNVLAENVELEEINPALKIDTGNLYRMLGKTLGAEVTDRESAKQIIKTERYARFDRLIDEKFDIPKLLILFEHFENRNDDEIRKMITDNADIPTLFEYVVGIAWYRISGKQGDVLEYMNLSLEADLLPKTHAGGGEADIVWKYPETDRYPGHTLLIEATLADGTNQRRMEMEPVSRHLGEYRLTFPAEEAYCIFITTFLHINVISDFRMRKFTEYYSADGTDCITGMKILPLQTSEFKTLLKSGIAYPQIYEMLDEAYGSAGAPKEWYENNIVKKTRLYENNNENRS